MKRDDLIAVAMQGDYGKPRPALVIQPDFFDTHPSVPDTYACDSVG
jgi:mRNA interferase MazF